MTKIEALRTELKCRKMVEGTELDWASVIRHKYSKFELYNTLESHLLDNIEFALGIIEGRPVWEGDTLYNEDGYNYRASPSIIHGAFRNLSWNSPKPQIPEGFTPWSGGECPVSPRTEVEVLVGGYGEAILRDEAQNWRWSASCSGTDILAYRAVKPETVMVELLVEDAQWVTDLWAYQIAARPNNISKACRKALENPK